ncbi:MAG: tRNA threonylcarbamoyladenosine dehydratase [Lautropia sp.]|nr:tRNA threonylcarbamoyladenosine dehydratase [Lautropia sp.]
MSSIDDPSRRFSSVARVHGQAGVKSLQASHAVVVGIGGVGSWAAEALARSGVGRLTLIDLDHVAESNINRQVHALTSTLGAAKVEVMAARILDISPHCQVKTIDAFVEPGEEETLIPADADVLIDAIDAVAAKASLIAWCVARGLPVITCGAAGGRTDPMQLRVADLARTTGDALLSAVRAQLRRQHGFPRGDGQHAPDGQRAGHNTRLPPAFGVEAIHSPEQVAGQRPPAEGGGMPLACAGYGSLVTVTAAMGLAAASRALVRLLQRAEVGDGRAR